jgi:hypothetical protein
VLNACQYCAELAANPAIALAGAVRATSLFRGRNLGRGPAARRQIDVLYGYPAFVSTQANPLVASLGGAPLSGLAGFGNAFNGYSWSGAVHDDSLFIGTFDFSDTINRLANPLLNDALNLAVPLTFEFGTPGADLVRINQARIESGKFETLSGFDNDRNWGFRTLLSMPCDAKENKEMLLVGTANPYSIHPLGGWSWNVFRSDPKVYLTTNGEFKR